MSKKTKPPDHSKTSLQDITREQLWKHFQRDFVNNPNIRHYREPIGWWLEQSDTSLYELGSDLTRWFRKLDPDCPWQFQVYTDNEGTHFVWERELNLTPGRYPNFREITRTADLPNPFMDVDPEEFVKTWHNLLRFLDEALRRDGDSLDAVVLRASLA